MKILLKNNTIESVVYQPKLDKIENGNRNRDSVYLFTYLDLKYELCWQNAA